MAIKGKFVYKGRDRSVEDVSRKSRQKPGLYDNFILSDFPTFKVKEGENAVRILPPTWEDTDKWGDSWELGIWVHYNVGADGGSFICLDKMKGEPCPVCEARREATDDEERYQLAPGWRALCWVVDRDNEKAGPQVWSMPATLFRDINSRSIDKKSNAVILIDDPEEGYDVVFTREGADKRTKYVGVEVARDPTPVHDDEKIQQRWLDYILEHSLPTVLNIQDSGYIEKVLSGKVSAASKKAEAEEEEDTPPRSSRAARRVPEPAEEEEAATSRRGATRRPAEPEEEEAEAEAPLPRSRRGAPVEPEEEEETPPTRRTARQAPEEAEEEADEDPAPSPRGARNPTRRASSEPEEGEDIPEESRTARRGLERLRSRVR